MKIFKVITVSILTSSVLFGAAPDFFNLKGKEDKNIDIAKEAQKKVIRSNVAEAITEKNDIAITKQMEAETKVTDGDPETLLLKKMKDKKKFNLKTKSLFIDKNVKFVKLSIPIHQISEVYVDKKIVKLDFLQNPRLKVELDQKDAQKITLINTDLNLDQKIKITFIDGSSVNLLLGLGNSISERHIEYKLYFEKKKIALLPEFQKKLKVRNIHTYFNNVSTKLILDRILQTSDFESIEENKKKINQVLFDGESIVDSIVGEVSLNYKLVFDYVYETPFVQDTKRNDIKKRLVMLELTIYNKEDKNVLILTPSFIKKRFGNYVAMYLGDLDTKENYISPQSSHKFLVVIEDRIKEEDLN